MKRLKLLLQKSNRLVWENRIKTAAWTAVRFLILLGLSFIILYPFLAKISSMFMSRADIRDPIVWMIPRSPTLDNIRAVIKYGSYWLSLRNTFVIALTCAVLQTVSTTMIGYGFARFRFRGRWVFLALVILSVVVPPQTIYVSLYTKFRYFDVFGLLKLFGLAPIKMVENLSPMVLLSATGLGLKNGLYILMLMQCFKGLPRELSEAAYVDGAGVMCTFWRINMPQARPMMVSVFLLSFAWQWTDTFYSGLFFKSTPILLNTVSAMHNVSAMGAGNENTMSAVLVNTAVIMMLIPLILVYVFGQRYLIQGIERSGMVM